MTQMCQFVPVETATSGMATTTDAQMVRNFNTKNKNRKKEVFSKNPNVLHFFAFNFSNKFCKKKNNIKYQGYGSRRKLHWECHGSLKWQEEFHFTDSISFFFFILHMRTKKFRFAHFRIPDVEKEMT